MWKRTNVSLLRIALAALGFFGTVFLPWWVPLCAIIALSALWRSWEAPFIGLLMDFLWLPSGALPLFTFGALVIVWGLEPVRHEFLREF